MSDLDVKKIRVNLDLSQADLAKRLGVSLRTIQNWESGETIPKTKHEILRSLWQVPNKEEEFNYKFGKPSNNKQSGIPHIPIEAMAGFGSGDFQVMEFEADRFVIPTFKDADYLISVKGSSMYPKYNSGDLVACKHLPLDTFFQWNKVYVMDTVQGVLIKRVCKGSDDAHLLIVSDNKSYDPFELHRQEIRTLAIVLGVIRLE